jgi:hypothetical protein
MILTQGIRVAQQVTSHVFLHVWVQMEPVNATHSLLMAPVVLRSKVVAMAHAPMLKAHESEMAVEPGTFLSWMIEASIGRSDEDYFLRLAADRVQHLLPGECYISVIITLCEEVLMSFDCHSRPSSNQALFRNFYAQTYRVWLFLSKMVLRFVLNCSVHHSIKAHPLCAVVAYKRTT